MPHFTETHPEYNDSYESMLDNLDQTGEFELTDWEADFVENMMILNSNSGYLSDRQAETIRNLVDKYLSA